MSRTNITARCHCGAVELELPRKPAVITRCNCSYCRQIDPLFAYYKRRTIRFRSSAKHLESYTWGRGVLQWFRCRHCGSFTHHAPVGQPGPEARLGVNMRLVRPEVLRGTTAKLRDGARNTWRVLEVHVL
ncbi:MAG TPA: GFA family protein [Alphaproteobacteria bacterium]|nr:GFA family protein [Alphaproteobacteria bacterium]